MERVGFSGRRVWFIALNTLREAVRQKVFRFVLALALLVVLGAQAFREFHFGSPELKFIADLGGGALACFGPVLAVVATAQLFFSELDRRTVQTLLAKPVWRTEFVLGKFAGVAALTGGFCLLLTATLAAVLCVRENLLMREVPEAFAGGRLVNYAGLAVTGLLQWWRLLVLGALTLLVACYARTQLFTVVMGFLLWVGCQLQHLALAASARASGSWGGVLTSGLARMLPNFQLFNLLDALGGQSLPWELIGRVGLYALAYLLAGCGLAVFCFHRREI
jgi:ABC-type transport system involved in multi-copper enzyme maturation permease subunit